MWKKLNGFVESLTSHWSLFALIAGSSLTATAVGFAAKATDWLDEWGPIAWVSASLAGAGVFVLMGLGASTARARYIQSSIQKRFFSQPDTINPLDDNFRNRRIRISDLVSPIEPVIRKKTFRECEIIGPANVVLLSSFPGAGGMANCQLTSVCAVLVQDSIQMMNGVVFEDCRFENCKLHQLTFYFPEGSYTWACQAMPGLPWLTPAPRRPLTPIP